MTTWDEPIPIPEQGGDDSQYVVEMMATRDVDLDVDRVRLLISVARQAHRRCLADWLRVNEPGFMATPSTGPYARWLNRRRGNAGRFRDGSDLARAPLVSIYFLCNQFYRRELGLPFHADFQPLKWNEDFTPHEQLAMLKGPALFFCMVASAVDFRSYSARRCSLIHDGNYKKLDKRIP